MRQRQKATRVRVAHKAYSKQRCACHVFIPPMSYQIKALLEVAGSHYALLMPEADADEDLDTPVVE